MTVLDAINNDNHIVFGSESNPGTIHFMDPDGTVFLLTKVSEDKGLNSFYQTYIHGLFSMNNIVSNLE